MLIISKILLIFVIISPSVSSGEECENTKYILSKCNKQRDYQWLIEVPKSKTSCDGKSIANPQSVPCNFACSKGQTFDKVTLHCKQCKPGTFSLGGGYQYTFDDSEDISKTMPELTLTATALVGLHDVECNKHELWKVKNNVLQGDVKPNCAIYFSLRFKLEQAGSITIKYNLATSYAFAVVTSRCNSAIRNDDDDDDDSSNLKDENEFTLQPTGYGTWKTKKIGIADEGEYTLSMYTIGLNKFHFPFSIASIIIDGVQAIQDCTLCPPGTYADKSGSPICKSCPINTYAEDEGSTECVPCGNGKYADEGSSKCLQRPTCEAKHYKKVFTGCDKSDMATITYEPIQPKICINGGPPTETKQSPCGTCNPGMYKKKDTGTCEFCPPNTYSNGTSNECLPCSSDLSLMPGLYYKNWNAFPIYFNRSYISSSENGNDESVDDQSWIPSIEYISSHSLPDVVTVLSLTVAQGFRITDLAKATKEYGTVYFKFSIQCHLSCALFFISQDIFDDDADDWKIIHKWNIGESSNHKNITEYTHSVTYPDEVIFSWLFTSEDADQGTDEIRIYETRVTNTKLGGSDRCVNCLTTNNEATECKSCAPGHILSNNTCILCPQSTIASRVRSNDLVPTVCKPCANYTISDDGISCYVPCKQSFNGSIQYDLNTISTTQFHGSKLFTQKGSGYFHVFNATICGKTSVTCAKTLSLNGMKLRAKQMKIDSKLCRMGSIPDDNDTVSAVAYIDDFGEKLLNISLSTSKYFPPLRSDYNLNDITLVYQANTSDSQSTCSERITFLSLRCDHTFEDEKNVSMKYKLQTPNDCATGTCDGCTFHFLLRTPFACPICDEKTNGFRTFSGPCKFGKQEIRKIPYPYCSHNLTEKVEIHRCSIFSLEIQIVIGLFIIIAGVLISVVIICWRKNRKLEYRYMKLIENANPDDDTPIDNVCAQISDEEDSGEEIQFKKQSRTKKIFNAVRNVIRKNSANGQSESFGGDSFLLTNTLTNDA